jgi:LEA14-like dessication related protein
MRRLLTMALLAVIAACGTGAVHPLNFIRPDVRLHHLELQNVGLSGGTLGLVLAFDNPNSVSLQGTRLAAGIDIEGQHFGDVSLSDGFSLAARDTTLLTVPLNFRWEGMTVAARSVLESGAVNYSISGRFAIITPMCSECDIPFSGAGNVPLLRP